MALIKCPECGKEISDKSEICIGCGYPIREFISKLPRYVMTNPKIKIKKI
ncbi:MAG: zinc ribbon domain-containing protein [Spirochaetales bacterium]|nr:zinc ribbon domain-containing protein [Spirochaetales bacterium]